MLKWVQGSAVAFSLIASSGMVQAAPRGNPYLAAGRRLYQSLEFEAALDQLDRSKSYPGTTPEELVQIDVYTGLVQFHLGNVEACRSAFRSALALSPQAQLPRGVSPKIGAEWKAIQREMEQLDQKAHASPPPAVAPPGPSPDKGSIAAAEPAQPEHAAATQVAAPPPSPPGVLAPTPAPSPAPDAAQVALAPEPPRSTVAEIGPFATVGAGVALAGVGTYFGLSANDQSQKAAAASTPQTLVPGANKAASSDAVAANVLFTVAGAAAIAGIVWFIAR